jgi:hypothetical protein
MVALGNRMGIFSSTTHPHEGGLRMAEPGTGCVTPAKGVLAPTAPAESTQESAPEQEVTSMGGIMVGRPAPDFEANALLGLDFKQIKLSDYRGQWVVLCFYPGDFTFV